jgi:hypothetical protein
MNPYVFIVGCPRSGNTLLQRIVDAHPDIAVISQTRWIPRWFEKRRGLTPEGLVTRQLVEELLGYDKFAKLKIGREELENLIGHSEPIPYSDFVAGLFDLYGQRQGKRLVGDKTPRYARSIRTLHALWPRAKFVHIIRDGRDVCLSVLDWEYADRGPARFASWSEDPVTTVALWWELYLHLGREAGASLDPSLYREVRYESLVARPAEECETLCGFLGVPYEDAMLNFRKRRERTQPGLDAKRAWQPVTSGLRDWRSQMPAGDVERFEAAVGDLLDELGYARAVPRPSSEALKHAQKIRHSFRQDLRDREDRLLERWRV